MENEAIAEVQPQVTDEQSTLEEVTATSQDQEQVEQPKEEEKRFTQEELDRILQKRLAKEQRRIEKFAQLEAENRMLKERYQQPARAEETPTGEPSPSQFSDYDSYLSALTDWKVEQKIATLQQQRQAEYEAEQKAERVRTFKEKLQAGADKYDDFDEVALSPSVPVTTVMANAIAESDMASDLAYYLGSHLDEAKRISQLTPIGQVRELAKLESKLAEPVVTSKAPKPITPITGRKTASNELSDDLPIDEWMKRRQAMLRNR